MLRYIISTFAECARLHFMTFVAEGLQYKEPLFSVCSHNELEPEKKLPAFDDVKRFYHFLILSKKNCYTKTLKKVHKSHHFNVTRFY